MDIKESKERGVLVINLRMKNVFSGYGQYKSILKNINIELEAGKMSMLVGPNGSGKTTLLRTLSGILQYEGSIQIQSKELNTFSDNYRARKISVVPQIANLAGSFTVRQVISLGRTPYIGWTGNLSNEDNEKIQDALVQTDLLDKEDIRISNLSGGERQRVFIARSLAQDTPILLLDEPTSNLDFNYQVEIMDLVKDLVKSKKIISLAAIHDLNLASIYGDHILMMKGGEIIDQGTPNEVITEKNIQTLFGKSVDIIDHPQNKTKIIFPKLN